MTAKKQKVIVAMSGGVDSSVAAGLLLEEGYAVAGVSLRLWEYEREDPKNCSDYRGAEKVAALLGIAHELLDFRSEFVREVVAPFARGYLEGRTPNPCVACNRDFKLGVLLRWAREHGAEFVATGHYARVERDPASGRASLARGADRAKDQSYFLFSLSQEQLRHALFPLARLKKDDVRRKARELGLPVADRPESQDICFGDYRSVVESVADKDDLSAGEIVDRDGKLLGLHRGIHGVTIGQRRGLGISAAERLYVTGVDRATRRVTVGTKEDLRCAGLIARSVNWIAPPQTAESAAEVQIRYRSSAIPCVIRAGGDGSCEVRFREAAPSVTPGQAAVFYRGDQVLGGGWIERGII